MSKNLTVSMLEPGNVLLFYDKIIEDDRTRPDHKKAIVHATLFIFQGSSVQGSGDLLLIFANGEADRCMNTETFFNTECVLLSEDQAPEVVKEGLKYVFVV